MRDALSSAAELPFKVAAGLTDEAAYQAEGLWPGLREEAPHDPNQLYHESSSQMRDREQQISPTAGPHGVGGSQEGASLDASDAAHHADAGCFVRGDSGSQAAATEPATLASETSGHQSLNEANLRQGKASDRNVKIQAEDDDPGASIQATAAEDRENSREQSDPAGQPRHDAASRSAVEEDEAGRFGSSASLSHQDTSASSSGVLLFLWLAETVGLALLLFEFTKKMTDPNGAYRNQSIPIVNVVFGALCWAGLTACIIIYISRWYTARRQGKRWTLRRRRLAILLFTELVAQWINVTFFLVPNIHLLIHRCSMFTRLVPYCAIVRWTCWNTIFLITIIQAHNVKPYWHYDGRLSKGWKAQPSRSRSAKSEKQGTELGGKRDGHRSKMQGRYRGSVIDAPWVVHAPKLIIWCLMEATIIANAVYYLTAGYASPYAQTGFRLARQCRAHELEFRCNYGGTQVALSILTMTWAFVYFALYFFYLMQSIYTLRKLPRQEHKMSHLQLRVRMLVVAFYTLAIALLWFVRIHTCRSYMYTWYGLLPLQLVETAAAVTWSFFAMPAVHLDEDTPDLQVWLQEFAWTEEEKKSKIERRNRDGPRGQQLAKEPMFCFDSALHSLYWSALIYDYGEAERGLSLEVAMGMYELEHSELFWEKARDTKLLMAWNNNRIVLAFRGTASVSNALSDVQAWRVVHPPKRGRWGCRPLVHVGFLKSWTANGLDIRVISRIKEIIQAPEFNPTMAYVGVTGHSLGGALAQLAAHDIARAGQRCGKVVRVGCYTYGSPRVGNHAFAREFNQVVPHCWHIINNQDAVARAPKFLLLYKRAGQVVIINKTGDMLVRPSFIENSILQLPGGGSVSDHLLGSYLQALLAIILSQFSAKGFPGGMDGVVRLAEKSTPIKELLLEGAGITVEDLRRVSRWHGRMVNPKVARATAAELVAHTMARKKKIAKKETISGEAGKGGDVEKLEKPVETEDDKEPPSLLQRVKRKLCIRLAVGPTWQDCSDNVGSRTMHASDGDSTSDSAGPLDRASTISTTDSLYEHSSEADMEDRRHWP
ncbi:probable phospholipase A1-Igamma1, chloroplastic at C-terminar half [Coccomyxa sp. Obi]|nr:probable phospholipase A1-Igamma1, chloroplastic at C-terminar half [Coccomyxa sp. Obi]